MYVWNQGVTRESECVMLEADLSIESTREALRLRLSGYMFAGVVSVGWWDTHAGIGVSYLLFTL